MADPLGISTGQGKGRAQVFGDTYNDYFAEKVKTGTEEKKVQQEELAKLQAADGLWDRDNELFKPKIEALRKYYRENARNIIKGDFDATTNLQAMKDDLTQFIGSSKASKEFYIDLKKKIASDPGKYSDATKARMDEYQRTGGRFDNDISFFSKYKASDTIDSLSDKVKSAGYDLDDITYEKDPSGKTYMIDKSGQNVDIDKMVDSVISAEDSFYGDKQVSEYWNQPGRRDQLKEALTSLEGEKRSTKYSPVISSYDRGQGDKKDLATILINDNWHARNYIPDVTEAVLDKIVESVSSLKSAVHTNSSKDLQAKYPGSGGVVFSTVDNKGAVKEEFIPSKDYNRFLKKLQNTKEYNSLKGYDLSKIDEYTPTKEELAYQEDKGNVYDPTEVYDKDINDYATVLGGTPSATEPATIRVLQSLGITGKSQTELLKKYANINSPQAQDFINLIKPDLIKKSQRIPIRNNDPEGGGSLVGGKLKNVKIDDNVMTFYFKDSTGKAVKGDYNRIDYTKKDNEEFNVTNILRELLKKGGTKVKVEEESVSSEKKPLNKGDINDLPD